MNRFHALSPHQDYCAQECQPARQNDDPKKCKRHLAKALDIASICLLVGLGLVLTLALFFLAMMEPII